MKMKRQILRFISVFFVLALLLGAVACQDPDSETPAESWGSEQESETLPVEELGDGKLRVIVTSDMHYSMLQQYNSYYGVARGPRMQHWVDAIKAEHEKDPIDLIIINGDVSFDHIFEHGSYTKYKVKDTQFFVNDYVSQLRALGIPVFVMAGNHEQYNNEQWKEMTGNDRQCSFAIEGNLFIMLDTYATTLEPNYADDAEYTPVDVDYVKSEMAKYPDHKVWLIAHYFDKNVESDAFKTLLKTEGRIKGLFAGHTHQNSAIKLGSDFGGKTIAQTGNFSYTYYTALPNGGEINMADVKNSFWGFRDLTITPEAAISNYIIAETEGATVNGTAISLKRRTVEMIRFY